MELTIAYIIAAAIPLICLWIIYSRNLYSTSQLEIVLMCFGWGLVSYYAAAKLNRFVLDHTYITYETTTRFVAPITEEILKAALLIYLVRRPAFHYFVDGAIYGFAVGIGFAVIENYGYIAASHSSALTVALARALSTNLIHATASAIIGVMLGLSRFQHGLARRLLFLMGGMLIAMTAHSGFNNMVSRYSGERWLILLYAVLFGFSGAAFIIWSIYRGLRDEREWIDEMLGVADQVTRGESKMVMRLAEAGTLLTPIVERFGKQKATEIGRLLAVQAQLGILRKTAQTLPDENMRNDAQGQIAGLQQEMASLRNQIGVYPMLFLRGIFPEENYSVWSRLETATVGGPAEAQASDFSLTDMLQELPASQRRVMQVMMRGKKRASLQQLSELTNIPRNEIADAVKELVNIGKLSRVESAPDHYEVKYKRKTGLTLNDNIWQRLSALSFDQSSSGADVWDGLKTLLSEQSKTDKTDKGQNLWANLAKRIPE